MSTTLSALALAAFLAVWISTAPVTLAVRQSYSSRLSLIDEHFELTSDADELPVDEFLVQRIEQDKPEDMDGIGGVTDMPSAAEAAESKSLESILMDDKDCSTFIQCRESRNIPFRNDDFPLEETGCYVSDSGEADFPTQQGHILPTVFLIGCQKCGTTSLYENLVTHPNVLRGVFRPDDIGIGAKEPHFFDSTIRYERDINWYAKHFPLASECNATEGCITIDGTPDSMLRPAAPSRIRMTYGKRSDQLKFLVVLRDPISRCLSFYEMAKRAKWPILPRKNASFGEYMTTLLESFQSCSGIIEKCGIKNFFRFCTTPHLNALRGGLYAEQLRPWLKLFDPSQFLVIPLSKLSSKPQIVMKETYDFLGLSNHSVQKKKVVTANKAKKGPTSKTTQELIDLVPTLEAFYADHNAHLADVLKQMGANVSEFDFVDPEWRYQIIE